MLETSDQNADADEDFPEQNLLDIQKLCSIHLLSSLALLKPLESGLLTSPLLEDAVLHFTCLMDRLNERHLYQPPLCDVDLVLVSCCTFSAHKCVPDEHSPNFQALLSRSQPLHRINLAFEVLSIQIINFIYISIFGVPQVAIVLQMSDSCHKLLGSNEMADTDGQGNASSNQMYKMKEIEKMYTQQGNGTFSLLVEDSGVSGEITQTHPSSIHSSPQAKHIYKNDDSRGGVASGGGRSLCKMEGGACFNEAGAQDGSVSFNREQIIVEVNLNNQTLNVSKGSDGKGITSSTSSLRVHRRTSSPDAEEGKEQSDSEDVDEDKEEYEQGREEMENCSEDEEENKLNIPETGHTSMGRRRATRILTGTDAAMRQTLMDSTLGEGRKRRREQESVGQKVKLEEKQHFSCKKCPRIFNNRWYLEKHMNVTHNRMQICNKCGKRFLLESELLLHHQTNCEKNIQCVTCGKAFKKLWSLHEHNKIVHGYAEKKFSCEICEKKFYTMAHVRKHMVAHTKDMPFTCETCGKSFKRSMSLKVHSLQHSGEKPFKCEVSSLMWIISCRPERFRYFVFVFFTEKSFSLKATICNFFGHKRAQFPTITRRMFMTQLRAK
ncbi:zinc finger protein [Pimephales promelas]|nr:zinc finger protein [Pimephales promelas]